jgi:hypothetical protein
MSNDHPAYVTITKGMREWFAVLLSWNPSMGGFYEPWQTHPASNEDKEGAIADGKSWAEAEGLEFRE